MRIYNQLQGKLLQHTFGLVIPSQSWPLLLGVVTLAAASGWLAPVRAESPGASAISSTPPSAATTLPTGEDWSVIQADKASLESQTDPSAASGEKPSSLSEAPEPQLQYQQTPLQLPPIRLFNLETANQLPAGAIQFNGGIRAFPASSDETLAGGSGLQVFSFSVDGGVTDRLQLGASFWAFSDAPGKRIAGEAPDLTFGALAPTLKYQILKKDKLSLGVNTSVEALYISSQLGLFTTSQEKDPSYTAAGSVLFPLTYSVTPQFQVHFTPGVAFFPGDLNGTDFYGTFFNLGAGFSWQPVQRFNLFADINGPLGPGDNTVRSSDGSLTKAVVWSAGFRYLVNPALGFDVYATNAFGTTPATRLLTFIPDSSQVAVGAALNFTPDIGQNYQTSFRSGPRVKLTERDRQLLLDGFTLTTPATQLPRMLGVRAGIGTGTGFRLSTGLTNDGQLELSGEQLDEGVDIIAGPGENYSGDFNMSVGVKLRFLDQVQGDPFSLALKGSYGQGVVTGEGRVRTWGIFELPVGYNISRATLFFNPKVGILANTTPAGIGLGLNYQLWQGLQFIGEFTPMVTGERSVWSVGLRYLAPKLNLGVDLYGSNAAGQNTALGGLVAQEDPKVGINIHWLFGGSETP